jgi:hypothetical protein
MSCVYLVPQHILLSSDAIVPGTKTISCAGLFQLLTFVRVNLFIPSASAWQSQIPTATSPVEPHWGVPAARQRPGCFISNDSGLPIPGLLGAQQVVGYRWRPLKVSADAQSPVAGKQQGRVEVF